jgi:hypothetical protein
VLQFVQVYWVTAGRLSPAMIGQCGAKPREYSDIFRPARARGRLVVMNRIDRFCGVLGLVLLLGCDRAPPELKYRWERAGNLASEAAGSAVRVEVDLIGGYLKLAPGSAVPDPSLLHLAAASSAAELEPRIEVVAVENVPTLRVGHRDYTAELGRVANEWRIDLAPGRLLALDVALMSGICELKLGGLSCTKLNARVEQGQLALDFADSKPTASCEVVAEVGTGQLRVRIPAGPDIGVRVRARKVVGAVTVTGLREEKDAWVNDAFETAPIKLDLALGSGLGGEVVVEPAR